MWRSGALAAVTVAVFLCGAACVKGNSRNLAAWYTRGNAQGRELTELTADQLPELYNQTTTCPLDLCSPPLVFWYAITPAGDDFACGYSADTATDGAFVFGGHVKRYSSDTGDFPTVGARSDPQFAYLFSVQPLCTYRICMVFREFYWTSPGRRVFNIYAQDQTVLEGLDIYARTGARVAPYKYCFEINVTNTQLGILFKATKDEATVSEISACSVDCRAFRASYVPPAPPKSSAACRILPTPPPKVQWPVSVMDAGGGPNPLCFFFPDATPPSPSPASLWVQVIGGSKVNPLLPVLEVKDVLRSYRWGAFSYTWPAYGGWEYHIRLTFAELVAGAPSERVFNVLLNNVPIAVALDVFELAGGANQPYVLVYNWKAPVSLGVGTLTLKFEPLNGQAIVNVIEVYKVGAWTLGG